jgi:hypothetical protein
MAEPGMAPSLSNENNENIGVRMTIESDLQRFISIEVVAEGHVTNSEALISSGKVDSLGLLRFSAP